MIMMIIITYKIINIFLQEALKIKRDLKRQKEGKNKKERLKKEETSFK